MFINIPSNMLSQNELLVFKYNLEKKKKMNCSVEINLHNWEVSL